MNTDVTALNLLSFKLLEINGWNFRFLMHHVKKPLTYINFHKIQLIMFPRLCYALFRKSAYPFRNIVHSGTNMRFEECFNFPFKCNFNHHIIVEKTSNIWKITLEGFQTVITYFSINSVFYDYCEINFNYRREVEWGWNCVFLYFLSESLNCNKKWI